MGRGLVPAPTNILLLTRATRHLSDLLFKLFHILIPPMITHSLNHLFGLSPTFLGLLLLAFWQNSEARKSALTRKRAISASLIASSSSLRHNAPASIQRSCQMLMV